MEIKDIDITKFDSRDDNMKFVLMAIIDTQRKLKYLKYRGNLFYLTDWEWYVLSYGYFNQGIAL